MKSILRRHAGSFQLVFVIAVVGSAVLLSASLQPETSAIRPKAAVSSVPVSIVEPVQIAFNPRVKLNGVVEARTVTSVIPQVAGRVVDVSPLFRPGATVSQGDVLFVIDPSDYELAVDRTLAEIEIARSELARLVAEGAAEREVWKSNYPERPIPDLIARVPQIAAAKARVYSGEAARAAARLDLERTVVRAPANARILETRLDVGQVVSSNAAVGSLFSTDSLEISVPVSADELRRIGPVEGRRALIAPPTGPTIEGTVVRKAASLDERTRLGTLFIASENAAELTLGEFVAIEIDGIPTDNAYRLPPAALTSRDKLWVVDDGQLVERRVEILGRESDMLIVSAFDSADGVVAIPPADVRAGLQVEPVPGTKLASSRRVAGASK
ncbi:MAG: efflux RND transporter periplasmic adaptor subunit [Gammaproteobacteria bacterium]|jgi:RND family efflux transporter MFP subunit|nr:efflux RND transporter periplasmic adaptor subunit [Gammaproteobacteria bacterium]MDH3984542.1 efflux RND transporter periplasmic adaptor subunit [Gammaproteobacteria bacterium]